MRKVVRAYSCVRKQDCNSTIECTEVEVGKKDLQLGAQERSVEPYQFDIIKKNNSCGHSFLSGSEPRKSMCLCVIFLCDCFSTDLVCLQYRLMLLMNEWLSYAVSE